jgi:hypothetical protein
MMTWRHIRRWTVAVCAGLTMGLAGVAQAGPPFITDDPEPIDPGHWEVYGFSTGARVQGDSSGVLAGTEVNFGAAPNLQLHMTVPLAYDDPKLGSMRVGLGDVELGVKYRFITPGEKDWFPQVGIFPLIEIPTGNPDRGLGEGETRVFLPIWLQKDFGDWTTYGGGGYWSNPGSGKKGYWFTGWLLQRQVTKQLAISAELFHDTAMEVGGRDSAGFNVGGVYDLTEHYHLLFSAGRGLQDARDTNEFSYYLALQKTF